jgi:hypothetical protein
MGRMPGSLFKSAAVIFVRSSVAKRPFATLSTVDLRLHEKAFEANLRNH